MSAENPITEQRPEGSVDGQKQVSSGVRVEECQFEQLFERAMVILNLRHQQSRLAPGTANHTND